LSRRKATLVAAMQTGSHQARRLPGSAHCAREPQRGASMRKITQLSAVAVVAAALSALVSADASATANRTFVSGQGSDSNPCSLGAPCRSFAQAITQTNAGGEITVLDSAGYGVVTISQSVTITNPGGVEAGITTTAGENAVTIDPTSAATVTLRGLTLEGGGVGASGIILNSTASGTLNIIDCVVKDFSNNGIYIQPSAGTANVVIANTFALDNTQNGIILAPQNANSTVIASIYQTTASGNYTGIALGSNAGPVTALISNSHADMNGLGILVPYGNLTIKNSTAQNNLAQGSDINNGGSLNLYNNNTKGVIYNSANIFTDGTNNIGNIIGAALIKQAPQ
jgi:hypothetical protein